MSEEEQDDFEQTFFDDFVEGDYKRQRKRKEAYLPYISLEKVVKLGISEDDKKLGKISTSITVPSYIRRACYLLRRSDMSINQIFMLMTKHGIAIMQHYDAGVIRDIRKLKKKVLAVDSAFVDYILDMEGLSSEGKRRGVDLLRWTMGAASVLSYDLNLAVNTILHYAMAYSISTSTSLPTGIVEKAKSERELFRFYISQTLYEDLKKIDEKLFGKQEIFGKEEQKCAFCESKATTEFNGLRLCAECKETEEDIISNLKRL